ncbi:hypothetical protein CONLIGDRAFT_683368 [Coniochaeta ligniaria NRRL 30616]|uniref:Inheritance of peroxisomes protein 1 n=1 Tax=Coniochaeta ligniaria NRRL 30616 TaxID=1408157 RepID=A0A1J7IFZ2_9PEZI|nr:hypothetical protein CONLIGDRAFT_683368 [Coniochaeta ligniaria NRRL 30616]
MDHPRRPDSAFSGPRRVFTAPTYAGPSSEQTSSTSGGGLVETLYNHPSVKVVAFNAGPRPVFSRGKGIAPPVEVEPGSLPWSSQLERTIAAGQFRIYRAPGSVAFLSCGSALQPILPKSQCWCVDEASSKYVLQIRRPQYWRIEVPVGSQDETRRALELREVLGQILQFEKTECPFKRGFTVELPERPQTPVKKRPWTPVSRRSSTVLPPTPVTPADIMPIQGARDEVPQSPLAKSAVSILEEDITVSDGEAQIPSAGPPEAPEKRQEGDSALAGTVEGAVSALEHIVQEQKDADVAHKSPRLAKPSGFQANRSVTAPPQLTLITAPPSNPASAKVAPEEVAVQEAVTERTLSRSTTASSDGSFHSVESWTSAGAPLPPSPPLTASGSPKALPYSQQYLYVPKKAHQQDTSDRTITPNTPRTLTGDSTDGTDSHYDEPSSQDTSVHDDEASSTCSIHTADDSLQSPTSATQTETSPVAVPTDLSAAHTTSTTTTRTTSTSSTVLARRPYMRHRPTTSSSISPHSRSALNRLPSAADLFPTYRSTSHSTTTTTTTVPPSSRLALVRRLPTAIIHKTLEILFSPPSHLIDLMLKVAARIAAGEWRGYVFGFGEGGERIPVRWDWSDGDDDGEGELGGWGADEDWDFTRGGNGRFRMAGAYPDSPEQETVGLAGDVCEPPESPSRERGTRRVSRDERSEEEGDEEEDEKEGAGADWTGSLSID